MNTTFNMSQKLDAVQRRAAIMPYQMSSESVQRTNSSPIGTLSSVNLSNGVTQHLGHSQLTYRPDIDGLRAIAVLLVLVFHADLGMPGGFIGVDVFFVISGYLMTSLLVRDRDTGAPSLCEFYIRRIRRIIPAATAMVLVVLLVGFAVLLPSEYSDLAKSAISQQLMVSNIYFWRHTGYFDGTSELKPLLHTWSLAIEEQFYVAYPLLLLCLRRAHRHRVAVNLGLLTLGSFMVSLYGTWNHPSATFYLLPTRAWELMTGGLVCVLPPPRRLTPSISTVVGASSLLAILAAASMFDEHAAFPGFAALVPCLATAALIYTNQGTPSRAGVFLASRPLVIVGLMSYSLYLWHWPILSFVRIRLNVGDSELPMMASLTCLALTFAISLVSWRLIEIPFRRPHDMGRSVIRPASVAIASLVVTCSACLAIVASGGAAPRFPEAKYPWLYNPFPHRKYEMTTDDVVNRGAMRLGADGTDSGGVSLLVWGDSHAMAAAPAFELVCDDVGMRAAVVARSATPPCFDVVQQRHGLDGNREWCDAFKTVVEGNPVDGVALVARWSYYLDPASKADLVGSDRAQQMTVETAVTALSDGLRSTIRWLSGKNVRVLIVLEVPLQCGDPVAAFTRDIALGNLPTLGARQSDHVRHQANVTRVIQSLAGENVTVVSASARAFERGGISALGDEHGPYYLDDDHMSPRGALQLLAPELREWINVLREVP